MKRSPAMSAAGDSPSPSPPADTRQRLLDAAGMVFAEHGFAKATIRQITDQAEVNLASVNYHFRDKAELYATVMRDCFYTLSAPAAMDPSLPAEDRLHHWIDRFVRERYGHNGPSWRHQLMARELQEPTPVLQSMVKARLLPEALELKEIIRELHPGKPDETQLYLIGFSIVGQVLFYLTHAPLVSRIYPPFGETPPDITTLTDHVHRFSLAAILHYPTARPKSRPKKGKPGT